MIAGFLAALRGSRLAQRVVHVVLAVAAVVLLVLACRRSGERLGRVLEQRETLERSNEVQRKMLEAAARRPRDRGELAERLRTAGSEQPAASACPPVVDYGAAEQAQVTAELDALPEGTLLFEVLSDYAVMRDQARACGSR